MTKTEQQLRDALSAVADLVQPTEPSPAKSAKRQRSPWLGPLSVAAAIVLIVGLGIAASQWSPGKGAASEPATINTSVPPVGPSRPSRFFAQIQATVVKVFSARTGRLTQTVPNPKDAQIWTTVSATRDDQLFLLAGAPTAGPSDDATLYWLRLDADGRLAGLTRIDGFHSPQHLLATAVSPDATQVAYALPLLDHHGSDGPVFDGGIAVLNLATGHTQTYKLPGDFRELSWADDGRHLAFTAAGTSGNHDGLWVLDTQAGKDLYRASHRVVAMDGGPLGELTTPVLSADGSKVYAIAAQTELPTGGPNVSRLIEIDVATGRQLRVLYGEKYSGAGADGNTVWQFTELCRDVGTERLLIVSSGYAYQIDIKTTHATRTPVGPMTNGLAW